MLEENAVYARQGKGMPGPEASGDNDKSILTGRPSLLFPPSGLIHLLDVASVSCSGDGPAGDCKGLGWGWGGKLWARYALTPGVSWKPPVLSEL